MPSRRPLDALRPGVSPEARYGFGRDYAVSMMTRRAFGRQAGAMLAGRATAPQRIAPVGGGRSRRPPG